MAPKTRDIDIDTAEAVPLRPATPIDAEIARPHPEDISLAERAEAEMEGRPEDDAEADGSKDSEEAAAPDEATARRERAIRANLETMR